ncbi:transposase [Azospirillum formosense]|uniref:Transposase n=1 Tax=Azospirillum formosense TaxID=861533 RepID=A0ABX2KSU8_9PROT|nr:transposase [Azospirillum formosense]MBY3754416.1 transposase [Azospirillum formosense]NUB18708.1 transposase [Azospirillum formosense]
MIRQEVLDGTGQSAVLHAGGQGTSCQAGHRGERPISQIAGDLGIGESLLRRWRREYEEQTTLAPSGLTTATNKNSLEGEVRRSRRENERLRQEREILKKAVATFSEGPK